MNGSEFVFKWNEICEPGYNDIGLYDNCLRKTRQNVPLSKSYRLQPG
jgi:hypothetical protein